MAKLKLPFELEKPSPDEYVTQASELGYGGIPVACGLIYDISVVNAVNNVPAKYESLSAAIGTNGANIPQDVRMGGMSIKFIQSSDNKYVQYRYMGTVTTAATFTDVANWQGVDNEPTPKSNNLINSGGVSNLHVLKANELRIKNAFIPTNDKSVGDYIYYEDFLTHSSNGWYCDFLKMLKGDVLKINLSTVGASVSKLLLVTKDSSLSYNRYVVIAAQDLQVGMNTVTATEDCYAVVNLPSISSGNYYIIIEGSSITSNTLFLRDYTDNLLKNNSVLSVAYEDGYYDRSGVRQSSADNSTTGRLLVSELNLNTPFGVTLAGFNSRNPSLFSNVVIWFKDGSVRTYNVSTMNHCIVDDSAEYIAFCDSKNNLSTHKIYIEEDWQYRVDYRLENIENELPFSGAYDVSAHNGGAAFVSLEALLSDANINTLIPTAHRKGGMNIKFIQTSDNRYVQYFYMETVTTAATFTDVANWQGVDNEPTPESDNLVTSGSVAANLIIKRENCQFYGSYYHNNTFAIGNVFVPTDVMSSGDYAAFFMFVRKYEKVVINYLSNNPGVVANKYAIINKDSYVIESVGNLSTGRTEYTATEDCIIASTLFRDAYVAIDGRTILGNAILLTNIKREGDINWEFLNEYFKFSDVIETITTRNTCKYPGRYYSNSYLTVGNTVELTEPKSSSGDYGAHWEYLKKGDKIEINYNGINPGGAANKLAIVNKNTLVVLETYTMTSGIISYTATQDCIVMLTLKVMNEASATLTTKRPNTLIANIQEEINEIEEQLIAMQPEIADCDDIVISKNINVDSDVNRVIFLRDLCVADISEGLIVAKRNDSNYAFNANLNNYGRYDLPASNCIVKFSRFDKSYRLLAQKQVNINLLGSPNTSDHFNVCICGDSLIDGTNAPCETYRLLGVKGYNITQIGTRTATMDGVTYKHEGRGGWSYKIYMTESSHSSKTNAFWYDGEINFKKYMQEYYPDNNLDVFLVSLGTNDVGGDSRNTIITDTELNTYINSYVKPFFDALLSNDKGFPNCKVIIGLPAKGAPTSNPNFGINVQRFNKKMLEIFDNGVYNSNITCITHGFYISRVYNYQHNDLAINSYTPDTVKVYTDGIHPKQDGYKAWGSAYYAAIRGVFDNND